jgi:lincosamide nucleotidyltransferase A/C/D/E
VLRGAGYVTETDALPIRIELAADTGRRVDVRPVVVDAAGNGVQAARDGSSSDYPAAAFTLGHIRDRDVPCLSAAHQRLVHDGYPHREQDRHDLAQLSRIAP